MKTSTRAALTAAVFCAAGAVTAAPVDLVLQPKPQSYTDSCQSWGITFAAASAPGTNLPASNAKELRVSEKEFRTIRDAMAKATGQNKFSHELWKQALENASGGLLTLKIEYVKDAETFFTKVEQLTGVSDAQLQSPMLAAALLKTPVLTSFVKVDASSYATGHIVPLLGIQRGNSSPPGLALLNPAVKGGASPEKIVCELDDTVGDKAYQAYFSITKQYTFKPFAGGILMMTIVRK